jgi:hypothetical protein
VLADWLLDQPDAGSQARGEFIHTQCRLARMTLDDPQRPELEARQAQLLPEHPQRWTRPFRRREAKAWSFGRGLVEGLTLRRADFDRVAELMWRSQPVQRLHLMPGSDWGTRLRQWPELERVRALQVVPLEVQTLTSPRLAGLRELTISHLLSSAGQSAAQLLLQAHWLSGLERLTFMHAYLGQALQVSMLNRERLPRLHSLATHSLVGVEAILPQLRRFEMIGGSPGELAQLVFRMSGGIALEELSLRSCALGRRPNALAELLQLPVLRQLRVLELHDTSLSAGSFTALADLLKHGRLVRLVLHEVLTSRQAETLASSGRLRNIRELTLSTRRGRSFDPNYSLGREAIQALMSADLPALCSLSLRGQPLRLNDMLDLLGARFVDQLHTLDLRRCSLRPHSAASIAARAPWPRLGLIDLRGNEFAPEERDLLRRRLGPRVKYN